MKRRDFIKMSCLLGLAPLPSLAESEVFEYGKVLIIGAGAAGLSAAYLLEQYGVDYQILEASQSYGGRMKQLKGFVDFPIPLGAEWLHVSPKELSKIVNDKSKKINTKLKSYDGTEKVAYFEDGDLSYYSLSDAFGDDFEDQKFVNSTWLGFFNQHIIPKVKNNIQTGIEVASVDYKGEGVRVKDKNNKVYEADVVIVTVPVKTLQDQKISFNPKLPKYKYEALEEAPIWGGLKVFIEFEQSFYPSYLAFEDSETKRGQRLYYDASVGQESSANVLGLFAVGKQAEAYRHSSKEKQLTYILKELDEVFDGKASKFYKKHIVQDWSKEAFIESAYLADNASSWIAKDLSYTVKEKVFFAGDTYSAQDDWGGVHNATRSARRVIDELVDLYS